MLNFFKKKKDLSGMFPFDPTNLDIVEKRRKFLEKYSISPDYHLSILSYIDENFGLRGKRILELGGSNIPREIVIKDFGVKQYVGIDYVDSWWKDPNHEIETLHSLKDFKKIFSLSEPYLIFSGRIDDLPDGIISDSFDIIISFSSIEHFRNISLMLKKASDVLKKGGFYFASSEPIWSSGKGHHFWINENYNFHVTNDFDFAHLLYSKDEFLNQFKLKNEIEKVAYQIYDWDGINRFFYGEIEAGVLNSSFSEKHIYPFVIQEPSIDILNKLYQKYGDEIKNKNDFSIRGIQWILKK
ncbi:MAG: methyltransferase domain-containing protein [Sphingobacteriia bacterium]|nr:methyltransferase domain-containing protein [Sphingobacteriia bacterium]